MDSPTGNTLSSTIPSSSALLTLPTGMDPHGKSTRLKRPVAKPHGVSWDGYWCGMAVTGMGEMYLIAYLIKIVSSQ